jgi:hypothetical protein
VVLTVRNEAEVPVRWLRIRLTDLLLGLDWRPGDSVTIETPHGVYSDISVTGEFDNGKTFDRDFQVPLETRQAIVQVRADEVKLTVQ